MGRAGQASLSGWHGPVSRTDTPLNQMGGTMADDDAALIDTAEAGRRIGCSASYARRLALRGEFGPVYDVSTPGASRGAIRVHARAVADWLEARRFTVPAS